MNRHNKQTFKNEQKNRHCKNELKELIDTVKMNRKYKQAL